MNDFLQSPRTPHLLRLWSQLCQEANLPQVDRWLKFRFKENKFFGSKDRRWYSEAIFQGLRNALRVLHARGIEMRDLTPIECWQSVRSLEAQAFFETLEKLPESEGENLISAGLPPFYEFEMNRRAWPDAQKQRFLKGLTRRVPLWLRLNRSENRGATEQELETLNIPFRWEGQALALPEGTKLDRIEAFQKGWLEIQDFASQEVGEAVPLSSKSLVWDCCAGGGGKSLQLAARGAARVYASDVRKYKLEEVRARAEKAGFANIRTLPWNGTHDPDIPTEVGKNGGFDLVLVDAPCSGSGTWRRSPDARFRLDNKVLHDLARLQYSILCRVSPHLRVGGNLVYATCSWLPVENEAVVAEFLKAYPSYQLREQKLCGSPESDADTLFVATLERME